MKQSIEEDKGHLMDELITKLSITLTKSETLDSGNMISLKKWKDF